MRTARAANGFQAFHARRRERGIILSPGLGQEKLGVAENAGQWIVQFVAKHFAEGLQLYRLFSAARGTEFRNEPSRRMQMLLETGCETGCNIGKNAIRLQ